jgi:hypothetical protein
MANGSLAAPIIAGLAAGIAFVILFTLIFSDIAPIIGPIYTQDIVPFPQIVLIDENGSHYAGNITTFRWGRGDSLFIGNISDAFGYDEEETTIALENGSTINFIARDYYDGNATRMTYQLPMSVYIYQYPSDDFEGMLQEIDGSGNRTSFIVDKLAEGDYYLRVNHQNQENGGGSVSYYFKVRIT